jgi:hypothetical protein
MGPVVKRLGITPLSVLLIGTLLLCHGVLGGLHLACGPPEWCAGGAEHPAEHQGAAGASDAHEHSADHATSSVYFAVLVGFLGLLLGLLPKGSLLRIRLDARWPVVHSLVPAVVRPPPTPTPLILQVLRL